MLAPLHARRAPRPEPQLARRPRPPPHASRPPEQVIPAHLMRSVAGGFDNESIAVTALCAASASALAMTTGH